MKNPSPQPLRSRIPTLLTLLMLLTLAIAATVPTLHAQTPPLAAPEPGVGGSSILQNPSSLPVDPGVFAPFLAGLLGKYGWLTTVLLAIGSLRILFKPIMLVVENALKNDPGKFAAVQKFEAGPIYKTIATVLDVGASIKLPLVKPPGPPVGS